MKIDSIEVIRKGEPVSRLNVASGKVLTSDNPSVLVGVPVGEETELSIGDTLRVNVSFEYRGVAQSATLYGAVGQRIIIFDELCPGEASIDLPDSREAFTEVSASVDIPIEAVSAGTYDLYTKLKEFPEAGTPEVDNVIVIIEHYEEVQHTIYPWAYTFKGDAETCTFDFKLTPEQVPGTEWLGNRIVDTFVSELEKEGARLLELKILRDTTPVLWTNYRVEVTATASPLAWNLIILGVLAIVFIVAIIFAIRAIDEVFFKRKPLSEETKRTFSRETLIAMILDLEPETSPETLAEKSDQGLRDLLNAMLREKEEVNWMGLAMTGGIVLLGTGAAFVWAYSQ